MPPWQSFCTIVFYSSLPLIWLCLHKMDFGHFGAIHPPGPAPRGYVKITNVFLHSSSIGLSPVKVSRFYLKWSRNNGVTLQTNRRTDGRWVSQYPRFVFEKRGDNKANTRVVWYETDCSHLVQPHTGPLAKVKVSQKQHNMHIINKQIIIIIIIIIIVIITTTKVIVTTIAKTTENT